MEEGMGTGKVFKFRKCGTEYNIMTGVGFAFPSIYRETIEDIKTGKYGEELRDLFENDPGLAVDCETDLYVCECGNWTTEINLDVYEPLNEDVKERYARYMYVTRDELKKDFKLVRHHELICDKCGKKMKRIKHPESYAERYGLTCPECGEKNTAEKYAGIMWD